MRLLARAAPPGECRASSRWIVAHACHTICPLVPCLARPSHNVPNRVQMIPQVANGLIRNPSKTAPIVISSWPSSALGRIRTSDQRFRKPIARHGSGFSGAIAIRSSFRGRWSTRNAGGHKLLEFGDGEPDATTDVDRCHVTAVHHLVQRRSSDAEHLRCISDRHQKRTKSVSLDRRLRYAGSCGRLGRILALVVAI